MDIVTEILTAVRDRFGISFTEVGTGGGCMALEARLESGHWIVATDEGLCGFRERIAFESGEDNSPLGWFIGVYPHLSDDEDWIGGQETVVDVCDYDASAGDLPGLVGKALELLAKHFREA